MYRKEFGAWVRRVLPWSLPIKLILSAILGVLGGAGLLGYLSEYATYNYAIQYGIRPPLEGIPYLRPAVAFGSIFLLLTGALVFVVVTSLFKSFAWYIDAVPQLPSLVGRYLKLDVSGPEVHLGRLVASARAQSNAKVGVLSIALASIVVMLAWVALYYFDVRTVSGEHIEFSFRLGLFLFVYALLIAVVILRPNITYWVSVVFTVIYFIFCIYLIFSPIKYSELLRVLGYGGGFTVSVELREKGIERMPAQQYQLMLRTNEAFIFYDSVKSEVVEVPRDQVRSIVHGVGGMSRLDSLLPERVELWKGPSLAN